MQSFSTPSRPLIPVTANVSTVVVLLLATWWSGAQRPMANATPLSEVQAIAAPATGQAVGVAVDPASLARGKPAPAASLRTAHGQTALLGTQWPQSAETKLEAGALQAVGYTPAMATR